MDTEGVKKLAYLARLSVPDTELVSVAADINTIIGFVDRVQQISVADTTLALEQKNITRDDIVEPLTPAHDLVDVAPLHKDHFVQVAKVIE